MKNEKILNFRVLTPMILLCASSASSALAQNASISVQQNGEKIEALGTAVHSLSGNSLTMEVKNGKAVVTNNNGTIASVPSANGGELVLEVTNAESPNTVVATVGSLGYGTLYSPFQLTVPEDSEIEVYAPTLVDGKLMLTNGTRLAAGTVVNPETGLVLKNTGNISFSLTGEAPSSVESALSGSSLTIEAPSVEGYTLYALGCAPSDDSLLGFVKYTGTTVSAGEAYLFLSNAQDDQAFAPFTFENGATTGIVDATSASSIADGKRLLNGRIVIVKDNRKYTVDGLRVK